ncbi:MAG TPA: hypothetical protein VKG38_08080 [Solirubrobacteraceae bacterium]|nr:hypothetical protein [Solirubrobacteraceae bacterium]
MLVPAHSLAAAEGIQKRLGEVPWRGRGIRELDSERVLVLARNSGRGKANGLELGEMRTRAANAFDVRAGRVVKLVIYGDRDRALADVGLTQDTGT